MLIEVENFYQSYYLYIYNVFNVFMLHYKTLLLLLRWDTGMVRDRFGGMVRFKGGVRGGLTV